MSKTSLLASLAVAAVAVPAAAHASVLWRGDYETGNISQWTKYQAQSASRLQVTTSPRTQGSYALRTELRYGDYHSGGNRAELVRGVAEGEGSERYYAWSTYFPSNYPIIYKWQVFTQWHHSGCCGSPPLEFDIYGTTMKLTTKGSTTIWSTPFVRGVWHKFVFHVKFSSNPSVGFVELWLNGRKVLAKRYMATSYAGQVNYLKQGLYRNSTITQTAFVHHDGMVMGQHLADVAPELVTTTTTTAALRASGVASEEAILAAQDEAASAELAEPMGELFELSAEARAAEEADKADVENPTEENADPTLVAGADTLQLSQALETMEATGCSSSGNAGAVVALAGLAALSMLRRRSKVRGQ